MYRIANRASVLFRKFHAVKAHLQSQDQVRSIECAKTAHATHGNQAIVDAPGWTPFLQGKRMFDASALDVSAAERKHHGVRDTNANAGLERALSDERVRLARELHDGVLQSLTGATLQIEALLRLIDENPQAAQARLRNIEAAMVEEQSALRLWIQGIKPKLPSPMVPNTALVLALEKLFRRTEWQWRLAIKSTIFHVESIPKSLGDDIYRLVQESLSNVGRHAHARNAQVVIETKEDCVRLIVSDDGHGFCFRGRYDLAALTARRLGPVSLKERVASIDGELVLTSTLSGSRIEFRLPLQRSPAPAVPPFIAASNGDISLSRPS